MNIDVLFLGELRELSPQQRVISVTEGAQLTHLIEHLAKEYGIDFRQEVNREWLRILINGREYDLLSGMETTLKDGDVVVFLPIIAGG